ncbi:hypothetical protein L7F22_024413 [Adiantum nelumboides]|nr:hypothetical protein [Adiantum nelumboides]
MIDLTPTPPTSVSVGGGLFTGFSRLCKGLSTLLVLAYLVVLVFPPAIDYIALVPGKTIPFAYNLLSAGYLEQSIFTWHQHNTANGKNLDDYNWKFWKALLLVISYRFVPLTEQIEKYCCGLPKGLRKYCTKTKVTTLTQLIEVANTGNGLLKGEDCEFNTGVKEGSIKKNSAKYFEKETPKATRESGKSAKGKALAEFTKGPAKNWRRPLIRKSEEEQKVLRKMPIDHEDKKVRKGKKFMAGLVPDMVGDKPNSDASELCRAWGKVTDQTRLIFFAPGVKANLISLELASKLGIRPEEMGYTAEEGLACLGHSEVVTPIIGKVRLNIQSYVDVEEFYIMPLDGCDVLLGIPWMFRVQGIMTITSVMKKHLSVYLVFAREVLDSDESNLSVLDKERSMFLQQFSDCFLDSLPSQLPPERPEDHAIDLVPGSSPPNRPPYRASAA